MKKYPCTEYRLDDKRSKEINIKREKLLNEYERLIPLMVQSKGWEKVDYEEKMSSISDELRVLNEEYESLNFVILH